jgi:23S rRNA (pseudouridine1915-N3)-methyltransferase
MVSQKLLLWYTGIMKFVFLSVGKENYKDVRDAVDDYTKRIGRYMNVSWKIVPNSDIDRETKLLLKSLEPHDFIVALDERGKELNTLELSQFIEKRMIAGDRRVVFIVGGAYGLDDAILDRADFRWSLSKLTFPHQLARLILAESVYRAFSVLKKEPYHHV